MSEAVRALQAAQAAAATQAAPSHAGGGEAFRATVTRAPTSVTDTLEVSLQNGDDHGHHADIVHHWQERPNLPAVGEQCLIEYDELDQPVVVVWYTGAAAGIAQQAQIDALEAGSGFVTEAELDAAVAALEVEIAANDTGYHHSQISSSATWTIHHMLGRLVSGVYQDSASNDLGRPRETHPDLNTLVAEWFVNGAPFALSGTADVI